MKTYSKLVFVLISLSFMFQDCYQDKSSKLAINLYIHRDEIVDTFSNHSIFRRGDLIIFDVYQGELKNHYLLRNRGDGVLMLKSDTLEFTLHLDALQSDTAEVDKMKSEIEKYASRLLSKMDRFKIKDVDGSFASQGIDLELYLFNDTKLVYVSDIEAVLNPNWNSYLKKAEKFDESWYFFPTVYNK